MHRAGLGAAALGSSALGRHGEAFLGGNLDKLPCLPCRLGSGGGLGARQCPCGLWKLGCWSGEAAASPKSLALTRHSPVSTGMLPRVNGQSQSHAAVNMTVPSQAARGGGADPTWALVWVLFTFYQSVGAVPAAVAPAGLGDRHARVPELVQAIWQFWGPG